MRSDMDDHDDTKPTLRVLGLATFLALPFGLLSEKMIRAFMLPPDFIGIRQELEPVLTPLAWALLLATAALTIVGLRVARAAQAKPNRAASIVGFCVGASLVQAPALLAVIVLFFGAQLLPVTLAVALSSIAIVGLYRQARAN